MKHFNYTRFVNVARWDLTINRPFYLRAALIIFLCAAFPVMARFLFQLIGIFDAPTWDETSNIVSIQMVVFACMSLFSLAYVFHNLLTRQGRIHELTLPASNAERFLWHVLFTVFGVPTTFFISLVITDLMHIPMTVWWGITSFNSLTFAFLDRIELPIFSSDILGNYAVMMGALCIVLMSLIHYSFFVLVNAWKYRYNLVLTFLYEFLIGFATTIVTAISVNLMSTSILHYIEECCRHDETMFFNTTATLFFLLLLALLALMWWATYRLYCRAQITSKRNP